jgi:predicted kinase
MAEAVIFVGLPGAGKSTHYQEHFAATHRLVSGDVHGTPAKQAAVLAAALREGASFVVDNTNVTRAARAPHIQRARQAGYRVLCCYFETPMRTAIARNKGRGDKKPIPVPAILRAAKMLEPPAMDEGFDEIRVIASSAGSTPATKDN